MRHLRSFLSWSGLYLLVVALIAACIWQDSLPVPANDHTIFLVGLILVFVVLTNQWINHHTENFLVSKQYLQETQRTDFGVEDQKNPRMEK